MIHLIVVDIDGTVSDMSHRLCFAKDPKQDEESWNKFISPEMMYKDEPFPRVKEILDKFIGNCNNKVVFLTGRNESLVDVTIQWFKDKLNIDLVLNDNLIMRPVGNLDSVTEFKERELKRLIFDCSDCFLPIITYIDDNEYMLNLVYSKYANIVLSAPKCWEVLFPFNTNLPEEKLWSK